MTRAALPSQSFDYAGHETDAMMASDSAQKLVLSMISYQTPSGGWSKHIDFAQGVRQPGQIFFSENEKWQYIATFNDDAIVEVLQLLDGMAHGVIAYVPDSLRKQASAAVTLAVDCILRAQVKVDGKLTVWGQQHDPVTLAPTSARSYELTSLRAARKISLRRARACSTCRSVVCQ